MFYSNAVFVFSADLFLLIFFGGKGAGSSFEKLVQKWSAACSSGCSTVCKSFAVSAQREILFFQNLAVK